MVSKDIISPKNENYLRVVLAITTYRQHIEQEQDDIDSTTSRPQSST